MDTGLKEKILRETARNQTPLFIYDGAEITRKYQFLSELLQNRFEIFYSVKANPNLDLLRLLRDLGAGAEVASGGELYRAIEAGFDRNQIVFAGPGKIEADLTLAIREGILAIQVESLHELERIAARVSRLRESDPVSRVNLSIRINPVFPCENAKLQMSGLPSQFGIDLTELETAISRILGDPNLRFQGFHIFYGSQILIDTAILENFRNIFSLMRQIREEHNLAISLVDFGGGFGEPCYPGETELNPEVLKEGIRRLLEEFNDFTLSGPRMIVESGRFLTSRTGYYVCRVLRTEVKNQQGYAVLDGGVQHHSQATCFGGWLRRNYPLVTLREGDSGPESFAGEVRYDLWGPNNTVSDLLGKGVPLQPLKPGDLVIFKNSGAYCYTVSPNLFGARPPATEIVV